MDNIKNELENKDSQYNFFNDTILSKLNSEGICAFVYAKDSLIAWSDNDYLLSGKIIDKRVRIEHIQNAYVLVKDYKLRNISLKLSYSIKTSYKFENEYLKNQLNPKLGILKKLNFVNNRANSYKILSPKGNIIAYNIWEKDRTLNSKQQSILFLLFVLSFAFLLQFSRKLINGFFISKAVSLIVFVCIVFIASLGANFLHLPKLLFDSAIFDPSTFASSTLISSLGSLFY